MLKVDGRYATIGRMDMDREQSKAEGEWPIGGLSMPGNAPGAGATACVSPAGVALRRTCHGRMCTRVVSVGAARDVPRPRPPPAHLAARPPSNARWPSHTCHRPLPAAGLRGPRAPAASTTAGHRPKLMSRGTSVAPP
jgi:hypothetical protein